MDIDPLQGRVIDGRYELLERIGEGSMGAVYRARQRVVDRLVAVKLLHGEAADEGEFRTRFEREAKALGRFDHPGCVRVYDFGWFADVDAPFLVSEFIEGEPLYDRLAHTMSPLERIGYVREIADAMAHAHSHGIIHRDLKPENILVTPAGRIKVVDFGLARMTADEEIRLTQAGDAHGTPAYMSPEQCRGDAELTPACDVYALGCVLFELFERRLPFTASTASGVMIKHVTDPIPRQVNAATPPAVQELIIAMMQKAASERPTMTEVAARLDEVMEELAPGAGSIDHTNAIADASAASIADTLPRAAQLDAEDAEDPLRVTTWLQSDEDEEFVASSTRPRFLAVGIAVLVVFALLGFLLFTELFQAAERPADEASLPPADEPPTAAVAPETAPPDEAPTPTEVVGADAPPGDDESIEDAQLAKAADEVPPSPSPPEVVPEPEQKNATPAPAAAETQAQKDEREAAEKRRRSVKLRY